LSSRRDDTNKNIPSGDPKSLPRIVKSLSDRVRSLDLLQAASDASARVAKEGAKKRDKTNKKNKQKKMEKTLKNAPRFSLSSLERGQK